jgi:hypothetical protein
MAKRLFVVTLEVCESKMVELWAEDEQDAVHKADELARSGEHRDARVDWVHEMRLVHHG